MTTLPSTLWQLLPLLIFLAISLILAALGELLPLDTETRGSESGEEP